jgi:LmbE family N-acetylglucosaminyl deacetylase
MPSVLVVAPHPDDEVLGVGGAVLRRLADGDPVHVVVCTRGREADFGREQVERVQTEARRVHEFLGVTGSSFLDLPAARLDTIPGAELHAALQRVFDTVRPSIVYVPHVGDVHRDHQLVFQAALICCRPNGRTPPRQILAYETVSETDWYAPPLTPAFVPNVYVDITPFIERKLKACAMYESQLRPSPNQRSLEGIRSLASLRGHAVNVACAEAFMLIRQLV